MASRHLLGTSPFCSDPSEPGIDRTRSRSGRLAHLAGMDTSNHNHDLTQHTDAASEVAVLSLSELAARLRVSVQTIYDLRSQGRGPRGFRVGRELRFRISEVDAWLARLEDADARRHPEPETSR
jgi:excisionase family DNA binding protein